MNTLTNNVFRIFVPCDIGLLTSKLLEKVNLANLPFRDRNSVETALYEPKSV